MRPLSVVLFCVAVAAQAPQQRLADLYRARLWDANAGIHHPTARCLAQTPDGFVWVGTFDGIAQLDGARVDLHRPGTQGSNEFVSLHVDVAGRLWAGTTADVVCHERGRWRILGREYGWPGGTVRSIVSRDADQVWFATESDVLRWNGAAFVPMPRPAREVWDHGALALAVDRDGHVWAQSASCLSVWNNVDRWNVVHWRETPDVQMYGLLASRRGGVWIGEADRVHRWVPGTSWTANPWRDERVLPESSRGDALAMLEDRDDRLWVGMFFNGLCAFAADGTLSVAEHRGLLPDSHVASLMEDQQGNLWVGTGGGGAVQLSRKEFAVYHTQTADPLDGNIASLCEAEPGVMVLATAAGSLVRVTNGVETPCPAASAPSGATRLQAITRGADGTLWLATSNQGIWRSAGAGWEPVRELELPATGAAALCADRRGGLWVGTQDGCLAWRKEGVRAVTASGAAGLGQVACFLEDRDGTLWIGTSSGLFLVPQGQFQAQPAPTLPTGTPVHCMLLDRDGSFWAAVGRHQLAYSAAPAAPAQMLQDLTPERPSALLADLHGDLWIGGATGIRRIRRGALMAALQGGEAPPWHEIDRGDGLPSADAGRANRPSAVCASDGRLWFATTCGAVVIDPEHAPIRDPGLRTTLLAVVADGVTMPPPEAGQVLELPAGTRRMRVRFTAAEFDRPGHLHFAYRLGDDPWRECASDRAVDFPELRPGSYHLQVRAGLDREWRSLPAAVHIRVAARLHEAPWFWVVCGPALAALMAGSWWWTARRRARRHAERMQERNAVAAQLRALADMLHQVTDSIPAQVFYLSTTGSVRFCNRAFAAWTGRRAQELVGRPLADLLPATARQRYLDLVQQALGGQPVHAELELAQGDQPPRSFHVELMPQRGDDTVAGVFGMAMDISERKRAEVERVELEARLHQAHKMEAIGTLAGGIAHDFNNILTAILGNAEVALLQLRASQDPSQRLHEVVRASQRARDVVRQILAFSRKRSQERQVMDVGPVVEEAMRLVRSSLPSTVAIQVALQPCPPTLADATGIHQVLMNLCSNAAYVLANRPDAAITVSLAPVVLDAAAAGAHQGLHPGRFLELTVADNGPGMDAATLQRIFDPFFTTKPPGEGTGLGLAVVHGIVQQHEGAIAVTSTPGRGTTFRVLLPEAVGPLPGAVAPGEALPMGQGQDVLFVDDEALILNAVVPVIEGLNYRVTACGRPDAALELFRAQPQRFALVVTDLTMPGMTGMELAWSMRQIRADVPIVLTSGGGRGSLNAGAATALGFRGFLPKPYRRPELAQVLATVLASPQPAASSPQPG